MVQGPRVTLGLDLFGDINAVNGTKVGWEITEEIFVWNIAWVKEATTYDNNCILYIFVYINKYIYICMTWGLGGRSSNTMGIEPF
jgi:hypothetical protein